MQNDHKPQQPGVAGGVIAIVVTGVVLGLAFNALGRSGHPQHGLAWLRQAEHMEKLEDVAEAAPADTAATPMPVGVTAPETNTGTTVMTPASAPPPPQQQPQQQKPASKPAAPASMSGRAEAAVKPPAWSPPGASTASKTMASTAAPPAGAAKPAADGNGGAAPTSVASPAAAPNLPTIPVADHPIAVELSTFKKFFDARAAAIVDARDKEEYVGGHVPGAESIPFDDLFSNPSLLDNFKPGDRPIICYCSGPGCDLSEQLANSLIDAGFKRVLVFGGGFPAWEGAGYPVAKGSEPGGH